MNKFTRTALPLAIVMALAACQETPQETAEDVSDARVEAAEDTREARQDYVEADTMEDAIDEREDLELAAAEGAYEVAKEQCDALEGEAEEACNDEAEANYEAAKEAAQRRQEAGDDMLDAAEEFADDMEDAVENQY